MRPITTVAALAALTLTSATFAASIGTDNAANAPYADGFQPGDNGGSGFGVWTLAPSSNSGNAGFFIYTSTQNGNGDSNNDGDIDSSSKAWGLYANSGQSAVATRAFTGLPLALGQTFSIDLDTGYIDNGSRVGVALLDSTGDAAFEFYFRGGRSFYTYSDGLGSEHSTAIGFTDEGLHLTFSLGQFNTYTATITPRDGSAGTSFIGSLTSANYGDISGLRLFNENAGPDAPRDAYFNNLSITGTPAPAPVPLPAAAIGALPLLALTALRRRRVG